MNLDITPVCNWTTMVIQTDFQVKIAPFSCRSWSCDGCQELRLRQLWRLAMAGDPVTFITLTSLVRNHMTPDLAARELRDAWRVLVREIKQKGISEKLEYLCVFEETKQGWPHLHILARCGYIDQSWLSNRMEALATSPIVDIRRIKSRWQMARYVSKYVSKAPRRYDGCKRYWTSQNYLDTENGKKYKDKKISHGVIMVDEPYQVVVERFRAARWQVAPGNSGHWEAWPTLNMALPIPAMDAWWRGPPADPVDVWNIPRGHLKRNDLGVVEYQPPEEAAMELWLESMADG